MITNDDVNGMIVIAVLVAVVPVGVVREVHAAGAVATLTDDCDCHCCHGHNRQCRPGGTRCGSCHKVVGGFVSLRGARWL